MRLDETLGELLPEAVGHQILDLSRVDHAPHQRRRLLRDAEVEARGEARHAQDSHRVFGKGFAHVAQHPVPQIALAAERIDQRTVLRARHRIEREVAPPEVFLKRHLGRRVDRESPVSPPALALGARERVLLLGLGMQAYRAIASHRASARRGHLRGRRA